MLYKPEPSAKCRGANDCDKCKDCARLVSGWTADTFVMPPKHERGRCVAFLSKDSK
jgi:hypothetical protein